jgi:hypothetical protein
VHADSTAPPDDWTAGTLLGPQIQEFYEEGLCNVLHLIPVNLGEEQRLLIESVIYSSHGYFRAYSHIEKLLDTHTNDEGEFSQSYSANADAFSYAWTMVDHAYALLKLSRLTVGRELFKLSPETVDMLQDIRPIRNYMDHLPENFRNTAYSRNAAPLFGWMSYQYTPAMRDNRRSHRLIYIANIASTHLKDRINLPISECSSSKVFGPIDNIILHVRSKDKINFSRLLGNLTLDLNRFSIEIQLYLTSRYEDPSFDHGGVRVPFPQIVARGDLHDEDVIRYDLKKPLDADKVRVKVVHDLTT